MSAAFPEHPVRLCRQTGLLDTHLDDLDTECGQQLVAAAVRRWAAKTGKTHMNSTYDAADIRGRS